jgi:aromatic-L-amino-acid/L-tryptophan decarboxylase
MICPEFRNLWAGAEGADSIVVNPHKWLGAQLHCTAHFALKLWFVLRAYGIEGLRTMIRNHVAWSRELCDKLRGAKNFEIASEPILSLWAFRYAPKGAADLDALNLQLVEAINSDGRIYLTQTRVDGAVVIRFQAGQFECTREDVMSAYDVITEVAARL